MSGSCLVFRLIIDWFSSAELQSFLQGTQASGCSSSFFHAPLSLKSIFEITIELQVVQLLFCKESYCANYICSDISESRDSSVRWAGRFWLSQQQQQHALWVDCKMVWALSLWGQQPKVPSLYSLCGLSGRMDASLLYLIVQVEDPAPTLSITLRITV